MKPDNSFFTEIFRKGFYQEARFVNEIIQTSRAADFGLRKTCCKMLLNDLNMVLITDLE
ncbi:hypothetical protein SAMN06265361_10946 [Laceyella tengchongensis]|uniref:Uncharacterized protein n=1 Tax=Laceyella tengchongensis TaxID=574699 RepID=A0AA45WRR9_9BACL|nr:hypothetical protein SAMN06265361_10946 [Laceyella tengchongensis]